MYSLTIKTALGALAIGTNVWAAPATNTVELGPGAIIKPRGYLVDSDIDPSTFYSGAAFLRPINPVNRDSNETLSEELSRRTLRLDSVRLGRRDDEPDTNMYLGKTYVDYGCDMSVEEIKEFLGDGVKALCSGGVCNSGESFTKEVKWMTGGKPSENKWLTMKAGGAQRYGGSEHMLGAIRDAVVALADDEVVKWNKRSYTGTWTGIGESCDVASFSNFIAIYKDVSDRTSEPWADTAFDISLEDNDDECDEDAMDLLGGIVGEVTGGSALFGLINVMCRS